MVFWYVSLLHPAGGCGEEMLKVSQRSGVQTLWMSEGGSDTIEHRVRQAAGKGISWIMTLLARVQITVIWHYCTDCAVFQQSAAEASPEDHHWLA
jgi:hypothetical protein